MKVKTEDVIESMKRWLENQIKISGEEAIIHRGVPFGVPELGELIASSAMRQAYDNALMVLTRLSHLDAAPPINEGE